MITTISKINEDNIQGIVTFNDNFIIRILENNEQQYKIKYNISNDSECLLTYNSDFSSETLPSEHAADYSYLAYGNYIVNILLNIENESLYIKSIKYTFDGNVTKQHDNGEKIIDEINITHDESKPLLLGNEYGNLIHFLKYEILDIIKLSDFDASDLDNKYMLNLEEAKYN